MSKKSNQHKVRHKATRVVLSEFLPYELPAGFSNAGLYAFLMKEGARVVGPDLVFRSTSSVLPSLLRILFGLRVEPMPVIFDGVRGLKIPLKALQRKTVPYRYRIRHGTVDFRELSIPHPRSQVAFVDFYDRYKSLITHFAQLSPFSIRKPVEEVRITVSRDDLFHERESADNNVVEVVGHESSRLRSFFRYEKFANLHSFYESELFRNAEKTFGHLLRLDVSRCFDSIYTHSIEWAVYGRSNVKSNRSAFIGTFPNIFDSLIRAMNEDETHGILIGPEVSRIFAELVLQRVDRDVRDQLQVAHLAQGSDYVAFRYVDDYFFFYNAEEARETIQRAVGVALRPYKMHLQESKIEISRTPYLTPLSQAKIEVRRSTKSLLRATLRVLDPASPEWPGIVSTTRSVDLVDAYKTVLAQTGVEPQSIANYALVQVEEQLEEALRVYISVDRRSLSDAERLHYETGLSRLIVSAIEFAFYVHSASGLASAGVKVSRISALGLKAMSELGQSLDRSDLVKQLIYSEVTLGMIRFPMDKNATVEGLYFLDVLGELGHQYVLPLSQFEAFLGCSRDGKGSIVFPDWMHGIAAISVLRYVDGRLSHAELQVAIESWMIGRLKSLVGEEDDHAERSILALDMLRSPGVSRSGKLEVLRIHKVKNPGQMLNVLDAQSSSWFTNWDRDDLHRALLEKRSQTVY